MSQLFHFQYHLKTFNRKLQKAESIMAKKSVIGEIKGLSFGEILK